MANKIGTPVERQAAMLFGNPGLRPGGKVGNSDLQRVIDKSSTSSQTPEVAAP